MSGQLVVIDGCGANLTSLSNALSRLNVKPIVSEDADTISAAMKVILPGVGAAGNVMQRLKDKGLDRIITGLTQPVLGICVGMQVLFESSEEDNTNCLGVIPGRLKRLSQDQQHPVPHMGWNQIETRHDHSLLQHFESNAYCYFVHSYAAPLDGETTIAACTYSETFAAAVAYNNFLGVQFHPERSGRIGSIILNNFLELES